MALYMMQWSLTPEGWAALVRNPEDRSVPSKALVEKLGGKFHGLYYTFGEYDGFSLYEMPDNVASMAGVLAVATKGHLKATRTTVLLSVGEAMEAMKKAASISFAAPKG